MTSRSRPINPVVDVTATDGWRIVLHADGTACHSRSFPGDGIEIVRALVHTYIAEHSLSPLGPPGVVGRGDHVYVEVHCRVTGPSAAPADLAPALELEVVPSTTMLRTRGVTEFEP